MKRSVMPSEHARISSVLVFLFILFLIFVGIKSNDSFTTNLLDSPIPYIFLFSVLVVAASALTAPAFFTWYTNLYSDEKSEVELRLDAYVDSIRDLPHSSCEHCGHRWEAKSAELPKACPKCGRRDWWYSPLGISDHSRWAYGNTARGYDLLWWKKNKKTAVCPNCGSKKIGSYKDRVGDYPGLNGVEYEVPRCGECGFEGDPIPIGHK